MHTMLIDIDIDSVRDPLNRTGPAQPPPRPSRPTYRCKLTLQKDASNPAQTHHESSPPPHTQIETSAPETTTATATAIRWRWSGRHLRGTYEKSESKGWSRVRLRLRFDCTCLVWCSFVRESQRKKDAPRLMRCYSQGSAWSVATRTRAIGEQETHQLCTVLHSRCTGVSTEGMG